MKTRFLVALALLAISNLVVHPAKAVTVDFWKLILWTPPNDIGWDDLHIDLGPGFLIDDGPTIRDVVSIGDKDLLPIKLFKNGYRFKTGIGGKADTVDIDFNGGPFNTPPRLIGVAMSVFTDNPLTKFRYQYTNSSDESLPVDPITGLRLVGNPLTFDCTPTTTLVCEKLGQIEIPAIPIPAAVWLFGTALIGLVGFSKRKSRIAA